MREIRTSGSEGGEAEPNRPSLPLSPLVPLWAAAAAACASRSRVKHRRAEETLLAQRRRLEVQADGQAAGTETAGDRNAGDAGQVRAHRVEIEKIHGQRVVDPLAQLEGRCGRDRADHQIDLFKRPIEILAQQPPHLQRLL